MAKLIAAADLSMSRRDGRTIDIGALECRERHAEILKEQRKNAGETLNSRERGHDFRIRRL
jgi:hypothetical protein